MSTQKNYYFWVRYMAKRRKASEEFDNQESVEEDVYTEEGRENQLDSDEINDWEAGFMEGYEE